MTSTMNAMDILFVVKIIVDGMELDLPDLPTAVNHRKKLPDQVPINESHMVWLFSFLTLNLNFNSETNRDTDAEWCQDMNCSTMVGKMICPNTCEEAGRFQIGYQNKHNIFRISYPQKFIL